MEPPDHRRVRSGEAAPVAAKPHCNGGWRLSASVVGRVASSGSARLHAHPPPPRHLCPQHHVTPCLRRPQRCANAWADQLAAAAAVAALAAAAAAAGGMRPGCCHRSYRGRLTLPATNTRNWPSSFDGTRRCRCKFTCGSPGGALRFACSGTAAQPSTSAPSASAARLPRAPFALSPPLEAARLPQHHTAIRVHRSSWRPQQTR